MRPTTTERIRVLRIIARMNIGGPAYHVSLLTGRLNHRRYDSLLLTGALGAAEGSFEHLAVDSGARVGRIDGLRPEVAFADDARALQALAGVMRAFRPHIVHTHTAKAGTLGRLAAVLALHPRPVIIHTFHGHVLTGYFSPTRSRVFLEVERALARVTDRLVGVSEATVDELVGLGVAPRERFEVIPIGLELDRLLSLTGEREHALRSAMRQQLGVSDDEVVAMAVGRLVPIKRIDVLLDAVSQARAQGARVRLVIAGDGEERPALEHRARNLGLDGAVDFLGFRDDLDGLIAATDVAVLSSDNEGTPVALIEAAAGGRPAVATDVGGVCDIVTASTGRTVPAADPGAFAAALAELAHSPEQRSVLGAAAREHVRDRWSADRLIGDIEDLYDRVLAS